MILPLYLAMTGAEICGCQALPRNLAYMACHFSSYSTGLSNLPDALPDGSLVILNDRIPVCGHDPVRICQQLEQLSPAMLLLDLQRPAKETSGIIAAILDSGICPTAVSDLYAGCFDCAVFLSAPPPHMPLEKHTAPWQDREIWLEAALEGCQCTITTDGCKIYSCQPETLPLSCHQLHCHYRIDGSESKVQIALSRSEEDLVALLNQAKSLGICRAVGLYQQLKDRFMDLWAHMEENT